MIDSVLTSSTLADPDDAVTIAPHLHEVIYEDDKMRILKVTVKPGDTADMH